MIADAIKDVSKRGDIVLDLFGGSGSTLIAAHKTGRWGYLCELDPHYCDRIIRRWQTYTKDEAILVGKGESFEELATRRASGTQSKPEQRLAQSPLISSNTDADPALSLPLLGSDVPQSSIHQHE